ncbi:unnamed protein product [Anisakis simplex]|uniref:Uncharacterized protein n=1 Tax=Anisakis simplex TaxID=6269 RepID=A0A0M3J016_ANISI|nr:unnamed protein product [Anisakis simplex]
MITKLVVGISHHFNQAEYEDVCHCCCSDEDDDDCGSSESDEGAQLFRLDDTELWTYSLKTRQVILSNWIMHNKRYEFTRQLPVK